MRLFLLMVIAAILMAGAIYCAAQIIIALGQCGGVLHYENYDEK